MVLMKKYPKDYIYYCGQQMRKRNMNGMRLGCFGEPGGLIASNVEFQMFQVCNWCNYGNV